jgi:cell division protein FtsQ
MIALLGVLAILAGGWWVTNSRIFELRTLRVVGNAHLSPGQIARLAGLTRSTNVFWFSSSKAERNLAGSPWIATATVSRTLPGEVSIRIRERFPVALVAGPSGRALMVAADGMVLGPARRSNALPTISTSSADSSVGRRIDPRTPGLVVAASLPGSLRPEVTSIDVEGDGQVTLWLKDGVRVLFGDLSEGSVKGQALVAVLGWAARSGVHPAYVDVRAPSAPALFPAGSAPPGH